MLLKTSQDAWHWTNYSRTVLQRHCRVCDNFFYHHLVWFQYHTVQKPISAHCQVCLGDGWLQPSVAVLYKSRRATKIAADLPNPGHLVFQKLIQNFFKGIKAKTRQPNYFFINAISLLGWHPSTTHLSWKNIVPWRPIAPGVLDTGWPWTVTPKLARTNLCVL